MEQPKQTKKLPGFYIALCCCVLAIGAAGFISQRMESRSQDATAVSEAITSDSEDSYSYEEVSDYDTPTVAEADTEDIPVVSAPQEEEETEQEQTISEEYTIDNPDIQTASVTVNASEGGVFLDPVPAGAILAGFSADKPEYNSYYCDWRTHNGIDMAADTGCSVSAIADGTVLETGTGSLGGYVVIDHGNGFCATYAQLGDINVASGDSIAAGSVIGTLAESIGENTKEPHLHFEISKDGKLVNPEEY